MSINDKEFTPACRAGALACMASLKVMLEAADIPAGKGARAYLNKEHADSKALADSLGPMPPFIEGAVIALASYIHQCHSTGIPTIELYNPVVAMTDDEFESEVVLLDGGGIP